MDRDGTAARIVRPLFLGGAAIAFACAVLKPPPRLLITTADGIYKNTCCLPIQLDHGKATVGSAEFNYVVDIDKEGAYVLPQSVRVMADDSGVSVDHDGRPFKLRLSNRAEATSLTILGADGGSKRFVKAKL